MNVVALKITKSVVKGEDSHVTAVMDMISAHNGIGMILDPDASQSVSTYLVVFIDTLRVVSNVKTNVLAVGYVAATDDGFRTGSTHANSCSNLKIA